LSSARIDPKDLADSSAVKESAVVSGKLPEISATGALKKAGLDESSPSDRYKNTFPAAGSEKPETQFKKVEVAPSSIPTPPTEKVVVHDEVAITGTHKGDPPARTTLMKVLDDKKQVVSRPYESISEKTALEDLFKRSLACSSEHHDIVLQLRQCYEVYFLFLCILSLLICICSPHKPAW